MTVLVSNFQNYNSIFSPPSLSSISNNPFNNSLSASDGPSTSSFVSGSGSGFSKRKRPTRLDIPITPLAFTASVVTDQHTADVEDGRDGFYSVYSKIGRRAEDRFSADPKQAIFGVFDGHGGAKAAEYAAEKLTKNIMVEVVSRRYGDSIEEAVKHGYLKTDSDFLEGEFRGGSCCVVALITKGDLVVSNAGDCRAVMSRGGVAEALTTDHRPSRQDEKERIQAKGGYIDCYNGVWRIQGSLAVSRGIGDRQLKQWVIAEPETRVVKISPNDEFLILASDGLWDKVTNQEAVDIVHPLFIGTKKQPHQTSGACKKLVDMAVSRGSVDDVSVMIIPLEQYTQ